MLYGRNPSGGRKYFHPDTNTNIADTQAADTLKYLSDIPLPNEKQAESKMRALPILDILKDNIFLDDIILIGLIILLVGEGVEDDLLLIMLVFIFFAGKN